MLNPKLSPRKGFRRASIVENPKLIMKNAITKYTIDCAGEVKDVITQQHPESLHTRALFLQMS